LKGLAPVGTKVKRRLVCMIRGGTRGRTKRVVHGAEERGHQNKNNREKEVSEIKSKRVAPRKKRERGEKNRRITSTTGKRKIYDEET